MYKIGDVLKLKSLPKDNIVGVVISDGIKKENGLYQYTVVVNLRPVLADPDPNYVTWFHTDKEDLKKIGSLSLEQMLTHDSIAIREAAVKYEKELCIK